MEFLVQNWWYLLLVGVFAYMMFRRGGCCSGNSHRSNGHNGHGQMGYGGNDGQSDSNEMNTQIDMVYDPECGMYVNPETAIMQKIDGTKYYFCSETCRSNFVRKHHVY